MIVRQLLAEWESEKAMIAAAPERAEAVRMNAATPAADGWPAACLSRRLRRFTALDTTCGSGSFPYPALHALNDIEHRVQPETEAMGLQRASPRRPRCQASIA